LESYHDSEDFLGQNPKKKEPQRDEIITIVVAPLILEANAEKLSKGFVKFMEQGKKNWENKSMG
jgi:hypothetical protein